MYVSVRVLYYLGNEENFILFFVSFAGNLSGGI